MRIDVKIPYDPEEKLAEAYNRALEESTTPWVLFLDQDVFLCNPHWYDMCLYVIDTLNVDPLAACIGCVCGGERHKRSMAKGVTPSADIEFHIKRSRQHYREFGNLVQREKQHIPGYFMLLDREIALKIGFRQVKKRVNNIDQDFGARLMESGYHNYIMRGLYIYHRRGMRHLKKDFVIGNG